MLAELAIRYRDAPMPGRTHGQHGPPVTFGYKVAIWIAELDRHLDRLTSCLPRLLVGQLAGATGTLAWQAEWEYIPRACLLPASALTYSLEVAKGLRVDTHRMYNNIGITGGLAFSYAVVA